MVRAIQDPLFGALIYEYGWIGAIRLPMWDGQFDVKLVIPCDEDAEIEEDQRQAFIRFRDNMALLVGQSIDAIFDHYQRVSPELRSRLGSLADELAPVIGSHMDLKSLVSPTELVLQQSFNSGDRIVGLLFDCSWDPNLGLGVRLVNELVDDVGSQDVVL